jgi:hypothetical protein
VHDTVATGEFEHVDVEIGAGKVRGRRRDRNSGAAQPPPKNGVNKIELPGGRDRSESDFSSETFRKPRSRIKIEFLQWCPGERNSRLELLMVEIRP